MHTTASYSGGSEAESSQSFAHAAQRVLKRILDIGITAILLVALLPVLVAVAIVVHCTSSGPVLFRQQRVGRDGRLFWFYKFRTMYHGNDPTRHRAYYAQLIRGDARAERGVYKLAHDPRITPVGRVLRHFSVDEFPQLINILRGEMSLVGPRPAIPYEVDAYGPRERGRLRVAPGLTGLWQVSGRCTLSFQEMIDLDLAYISDWSLLLDVLILLKTPWAVVSGKGAS